MPVLNKPLFNVVSNDSVALIILQRLCMDTPQLETVKHMLDGQYAIAPREKDEGRLQSRALFSGLVRKYGAPAMTFADNDQTKAEKMLLTSFLHHYESKRVLLSDDDLRKVSSYVNAMKKAGHTLAPSGLALKQAA